MSLVDLVEVVTSGLKTQPYVAMDADDFYRAMKTRLFAFTYEQANHIAACLIRMNACRYATVETFIRADTGERRMFLVATRSMPEWHKAVKALQEKVVRECAVPAEIGDRIINVHEHETETDAGPETVPDGKVA